MMRDRSFPPQILRWSELKHMGKSPAHLRAAYLSPKESTPAMRLGWTAHHILLGGDRVKIYEGERRGNAWKDFKEANPHVEIVTRGEVEDAEAIAEAVRTDPVAAPFLEGLREHELAWKGPLGRACAGRVDVIRPNGDLVELKTTTSAEPEKFGWHSLRMGYHVQASWYRDGARANGFAAERCWVISVETSPPYAVTVFFMAERALLEGQKLTRLWVERLDACQKEDAWPGYVQVPVPLDIAESGVDLTIDGEVVAA